MTRPVAETHPDDRAAAFAKVLENSTSSDRSVRIDAARDAASVGTPLESTSLLAKLSQDADVAVRMSAAEALAGLAWKGRLDVLATLVDDDDLGIATMAARGLAHARDLRGLETLRLVLGERKLRFEAFEALYELRDESLMGEARRLFSSFFASPFDKGVAALTLARAGDAKAREHVLSRVQKARAEERPMLLVHLLAALPNEGRPIVERLAAAEDEYLRESAILALARVDAGWWPRAQEAIARWSDADPHVSAELLLGLFEIDWSRAALIANAHLSAENELGAAARTVRLQVHLRTQFPDEVLLTCA